MLRAAAQVAGASGRARALLGDTAVIAALQTIKSPGITAPLNSALAAVMSILFSSVGITIQRHIEPRSLVAPFYLGALVTLLTVAVSSFRVSRLNVVAAIRDLPDNLGGTASLGDAWRRSLRALIGIRRGRKRLAVPVLASAFLSLQSKGPAGAVIALVLYALWSFRPLLLALIARGPLLIVDGSILVLVGLSSKEEFPFKLGVSLVLIGAAMLIRWALRLRAIPDRARNQLGYSLAGVLLVAFWSLPFDALQALGGALHKMPLVHAQDPALPREDQARDGVVIR